MSIFRRQRGFFPLFLLAAAKLSLTILTDKCRVCLTLISSALRNLTALRAHHGTTWTAAGEAADLEFQRLREAYFKLRRRAGVT